MVKITVFGAFLMADFLFVATGALLLLFGLIEKADVKETLTSSNIVRNLLFRYSPSTAAIVNAGFIFGAFLISIPALIIPTSRGWLKLFASMVVFNTVFTLIIGLFIWFHTLKTRSEFSSAYAALPAVDQSMIQMIFSCCGYENSTSPMFVTDAVCTDPATAAMRGGCISPFSSRVNIILDQIFTSAFGITGIDAFVFMSVLCLLQDRKEEERYRHIDEKNGDIGF